jgi:LL-diaminopimelate aminotransferase
MKRIAELQAQGVDVINLGVGSPDLPTPPHIVEALREAALDPVTHRYPGYAGLPELRQAIASYYARRFGVERQSMASHGRRSVACHGLDPDRQVLPLIGSKEGIAHAALAWTDPGDVVLVPDPGYPAYTAGALLAGAEPYPVPLRAKRGFLPDLEAVPPKVLARARLLWLNYPNNPTGAVAPDDFLRQVIAFAREHGLLIAHDAAYCDVAYDGYVAPSILEFPGAEDVAVEFNSLSKTYNMGGWRIGMAVGNADALAALAQVKSNVDTGIFPAVQRAAIAALNGDHAFIAERNAVYQRRRDLLVEGLRAAGLACEPPRATLYVWARVPPGWTSADFARHVLEQAGVWLTPGTFFGAHGEGYLRVSVTTPEERIQEAMERLRSV